jgi:hypothetical protein
MEIQMQNLLQTFPLWAQLALLIGPTAGTIFAGVGLLLNIDQSRKTNAQARAALVAECLKGFAADRDIQSAFYSIEYETFKYDKEFHWSEIERQIDKLLRHFSNIALAWQAGLLSIRDVRPVQYYVLRVVRNAEIQRYLEFIADWSKQQKLGEHPYAVLSRLCEKLAK